MKKLFAIVGLLIVAVFSAPSQVFSQNTRSSISLNAYAAPQVLLNDPGTKYGQIGNSTTAGVWYLGNGTSTTANGTANLSWSNTGAVLIGSTVTWPAATGGTLVVYSTTGAAGTAVLNVLDNSGNQILAAYQDGGTAPKSRTVAQLQLLAPSSAGETFYCSNCSPAKLVVSTGTSAGNFADPAGAQFK